MNIRLSNSNIEKIGVLTPNKRFLGSMVVMVPLLVNLKKYFPQAHITVISPRQEINILSETGLFDDVIANDLSGGGGSFINVLKNIRIRKFDILFTLRRKSERDWLLNLLSGVRCKIGFKRKWSPFVFNYCFDYDKNTYRATNFLKLLRPFIRNNVKYNRVYPEYDCKTPPSVWLIPCGTKKEKLWPIDNYIELAKRIILELNRRIIFILGTREREYLNSIKNRLQKYIGRVEFLIECSIKVLLGESNNCIAAAANDCGPGHIPQITGISSFILFPNRTNVYEWVNKEAGGIEIVSDGLIENISVKRVFNCIESKVKEYCQ